MAVLLDEQLYLKVRPLVGLVLDAEEHIDVLIAVLLLHEAGVADGVPLVKAVTGSALGVDIILPPASHHPLAVDKVTGVRLLVGLYLRTGATGKHSIPTVSKSDVLAKRYVEFLDVCF